MPRNGSGTYVPPVNSWNQALTGPATPTDWQALLNDIIAAITQSISKDGQTPITSPITFDDVTVVDFTYSGALTGGTGSINIGSGQIVKDTAGNLGFGVTPSAWNVVYKALQISSRASFSQGGNNTYVGNNWAFTDTNRYLQNDYATLYEQSASTGEHRWYTSALGTAGNVITFVQAKKLTQSGFSKNSNNGAFGGVAGLGSLSTTPNHIYQSDQDNTTLGVVNSNTGSGVRNVSSALGTGAAGLHYDALLNAVTVYRVLANGNVQNTSNSYGAISDIKYKENIVDAPSYLDRFMRVRFRNYNMIGSDLKQFGVIAQELEEEFPGLVEENPDFEPVEVTGEDGQITIEKRPTGTVSKSVKYSILAQIQGKVIQEQQQIINAQQLQIESILNRLHALESN